MSLGSLNDPVMAPLWSRVRDRLELKGLDNRGSLKVPDIASAGRLTLKGLLDRQKVPVRVDLAELERALVDRGIGPDLATALAALGFAVSQEPARRRAAKASQDAARSAAREAVAGWPEPWAQEWIDGVIGAGVLSGLDTDAALGLVAGTAKVLAEIERRGAAAVDPISRIDLAAKALGNSHALDAGQRLGVAVVRALSLREGTGLDDAARVWESSGVHPDLTSGPVLTWRLPVVGELAPVVEAATAAGIPIHLSRMALINHPPAFVRGAQVLIAENPRVVESAAQQGTTRSWVSAGGSPSLTVQLLVQQLVSAGVVVHYHGDFDAAGLALCARMFAAGVQPWRMDTADYLEGLADARSHAVTLPVDVHEAGATPWDPSLQATFNHERRVVHEERLLPGLVH